MNSIILILFCTLATVASFSKLPDGDGSNSATGTAGTLRRAVSDWLAGGAARSTVVAKYGPIELWDVSAVTNMQYVFDGRTIANLSQWDTSAVTTTYGSEKLPDGECTDTSNGNVNCNTGLRKVVSDWIAGGLLKRNVIETYGSIEDWDTSEVTNLNWVFSDKSTFNADLSKWDTSAVTQMSYTFYLASVFNADLSKWDTSKVTTMTMMFRLAHEFNNGGSPLDWDVSSVTDMEYMFHYASNFNQDLSKWNTGHVLYMGRMFYGASAFNQDVSSWDTSKVVTMYGMFQKAAMFNQSLTRWDTSQVGTMDSMFDNSGYQGQCIQKSQQNAPWPPPVTVCAKLPNGDGLDSPTGTTGTLRRVVSDWLAGGETQRMVVSMYGPIEAWDVSAVSNMANLFYGGNSPSTFGTFDADLSSWDTSNATTMAGMFQEAIAFNNGGHPLDWEETSKVTTMVDMFDGLQKCLHLGLHNNNNNIWPTINVCAPLPNGDGLTGPSDMGTPGTLRGVVHDWIVGGALKNVVVKMYGPIEEWDVSAVTNMKDVFYGGGVFGTFNADLSKWNTNAVTNMEGLFREAPAFTQDLSNWDVSAVTNMYGIECNIDVLSMLLKFNQITLLEACFESVAVAKYDQASKCDHILHSASALKEAYTALACANDWHYTTTATATQHYRT